MMDSFSSSRSWRIFLVSMIVGLCVRVESFSPHLGISQHSDILSANSYLKSKSTGYRIVDSRSSIQWKNAKVVASKRQQYGLQMGYNLPPSGGGGGGRWKEDFLVPLGSLVGLALFFASPLGGIFFAVTNSLLVLAFISPFLLFLGFQAWQLFYTQESPCPNCDAPVRILKNDESAQPSICFNCGSLVRKSQVGDGLELCGPSPNESFFNSNNGNNNEFFKSMGDIFSDSNDSYTDSPNGNSMDPKRRQEAFKKERTVIDVEVKRDD